MNGRRVICREWWCTLTVGALRWFMHAKRIIHFQGSRHCLSETATDYEGSKTFKSITGWSRSPQGLRLRFATENCFPSFLAKDKSMFLRRVWILHERSTNDHRYIFSECECTNNPKNETWQTKWVIYCPFCMPSTYAINHISKIFSTTKFYDEQILSSAINDSVRRSLSTSMTKSTTWLIIDS